MTSTSTARYHIHDIDRPQALQLMTGCDVAPAVFSWSIRSYASPPCAVSAALTSFVDIEPPLQDQSLVKIRYPDLLTLFAVVEPPLRNEYGAKIKYSAGPMQALRALLARRRRRSSSASRRFKTNIRSNQDVHFVRPCPTPPCAAGPVSTSFVVGELIASRVAPPPALCAAIISSNRLLPLGSQIGQVLAVAEANPFAASRCFIERNAVLPCSNEFPTCYVEVIQKARHENILFNQKVSIVGQDSRLEAELNRPSSGA
ncbi:hypothetical protein C8R46DRAFT_1043451 [Mycena filopes]|nr:hypothetical protein C8R46DRAFT_1043451 [Mycena filopes]